MVFPPSALLAAQALGDGTILETDEENLLLHTTGSHAGPWFLKQALRASVHFTDDILAADLVYVDDYCLQLRWLAHLHSHGQADILASYALNLAYDLLIQTPRWKLRSGTDFIFYDAHPGFRGGPLGARVLRKYCADFAKATMLIPDRPMRNICPDFLKMQRILVVPYNPNSLVFDTPGKEVDLDHPRLPPTKLPQDRDILLFLKAKCSNSTNVGKRFRWYIIQQVFAPLASPSIQVECSNADLGGQSPFDQIFHSMSRSRFCLALPGDSSSTRRLSEIMLASCIPVFLGPPYHSMPFQSTVDWAIAGVFFNISDYHHWLEDEFSWSLSSSEPALSPQQAKWWVPDARIESEMVNVDDAEQVSKTHDVCCYTSVRSNLTWAACFAQILPHLELMPRSTVETKLKYIASIRSQFSFATSLTEPPNAVNTILSEVCSLPSGKRPRP